MDENKQEDIVKKFQYRIKDKDEFLRTVVKLIAEQSNDQVLGKLIRESLYKHVEKIKED